MNSAGKQDELKNTVDKRLAGLGLIFTAMFEELSVSRPLYGTDNQEELLLPNNMKETNATLGMPDWL